MTVKSSQKITPLCQSSTTFTCIIFGPVKKLEEIVTRRTICGPLKFLSEIKDQVTSHFLDFDFGPKSLSD